MTILALKENVEKRYGSEPNYVKLALKSNPDYLKNLALTMQVGQRCQLENGARGEIRFIGRALEVGYGYFIGIELDEPTPLGGDGTLDGMHYFFSTPGKAIFIRPNKVEVGEFPKIEANDEI